MTANGSVWTPADLYALDLKLAALGAQMTRTGFAFDAARAAPMREHLITLEEAALVKARSVAGEPALNLASPAQLKKVFFGRLRAPVLKKSDTTDEPSLDAEVLQQYAAYASPEIRELAGAILAYRRPAKLRSTYLDAPIELSARDGRVHAGWLFYGTLSGRASSENPNMQNMPRLNHDPTTAVDPGGIRGLYTASPGHVLVSFDMEQLEARIAAYWSGDPAMIAACEGSDFHAANAERLFPKDFSAERYVALKVAGSTLSIDDKKLFAFLKTLRDDAKSAGFATAYLAEAPTLLGRLVAEGRKATLQQAEALLSAVRRTFHAYYRFQAEELKAIAESGYVKTPICGRRRYVGHSPIKTECANLPIQGGAADFMNIRILELEATLAARCPTAHIIGQVHDSVSIDTPEHLADPVRALCVEVFEAAIEISGRRAVLPCETKIARQWS